MIGPIQFEAAIHVVLPKGIAKVNFSFEPGKIPTEDDVLIAVREVLRAVREQFPNEPDIHLMDASTFFNEVLVKEKTGHVGRFAIPSGMNYDAEQLERRSQEATGKDAT